MEQTAPPSTPVAQLTRDADFRHLIQLRIGRITEFPDSWVVSPPVPPPPILWTEERDADDGKPCIDTIAMCHGRTLRIRTDPKGPEIMAHRALIVSYVERFFSDAIEHRDIATGAPMYESCSERGRTYRVTVTRRMATISRIDGAGR